MCLDGLPWLHKRVLSMRPKCVVCPSVLSARVPSFGAFCPQHEHAASSRELTAAAEVQVLELRAKLHQFEGERPGGGDGSDRALRLQVLQMK